MRYLETREVVLDQQSSPVGDENVVPLHRVESAWVHLLADVISP